MKFPNLILLNPQSKARSDSFQLAFGVPNVSVTLPKQVFLISCCKMNQVRLW